VQYTLLSHIHLSLGICSIFAIFLSLGTEVYLQTDPFSVKLTGVALAPVMLAVNPTPDTLAPAGMVAL